VGALFFGGAPGMGRSAREGAGNRGAKANRDPFPWSNHRNQNDGEKTTWNRVDPEARGGLSDPLGQLNQEKQP